MIGLVIGGLLLAALVVGGGFLLMRRSPARDSRRHDDADDARRAPPSTLRRAERDDDASRSVPTPAHRHDARAPLGEPRPSPPGHAARGPAPPRRPRPAARRRPPSRPNVGGPSQAEPPGGDFAHLDEFPGDDGGDGRAAGDALASKYRTDGTSSYTTGKYRARPPVPRGITLPERPAVATLLYLNSVEQAYHGRNGSWGRCASCTTRGCSCSTCRSTRRASSARATASA